MTYKDILAPVIALEEDEAALATASELAMKFGAKAAVLILSLHLSSRFMDQAQPFSAVLADLGAGSQGHAGALRQGIIAWVDRAAREFEVRELTIEDAVDADGVVAHARVADLIVMARASAHDRARRALIEDVLFKSGRPVLLTPEQSLPRSWDTILIGWNAKAEVVHAIAGAMPMLQAAKRVVVVTIDATPTMSGHSQTPGHEIAAHLARHGVTVEVRNVDGMGRTEGKALLDEAMAVAADLLVLGAYGHSRAQEFLFGGVTRELLDASPFPLLMAH
ncbi:MAG: universal stress protein [Hyphomonadaceae bacterium]